MPFSAIQRATYCSFCVGLSSLVVHSHERFGWRNDVAVCFRDARLIQLEAPTCCSLHSRDTDDVLDVLGLVHFEEDCGHLCVSQSSEVFLVLRALECGTLDAWLTGMTCGVRQTIRTSCSVAKRQA